VENNNEKHHYLRCPACGKLSKKANFRKGSTSGHALEKGIQTFGGRGVIDWRFEPIADPMALSELGCFMRLIANRMDVYIVPGIDPSLSPDDRRKTARAYLHDAEQALLDAQYEVEMRRKEVKNLLNP
jgi:hypothetical protein